MHKRRTAVAALLAAAFLATTACTATPETKNAAADTGELTVWTTEDQSERVAAQQRIMDKFTEKTGTKVKLVAIGEDQLSSVLSSSAAAGELPDVIGALSLNSTNQLKIDEVLDTGAAAEVVNGLGADSFSKRALELTSADGQQLAVPSDGFAQLLYYRKDLFAKAGLKAPESYDDIEAAAKALNQNGRAGIVAATAPADSFTQQTMEWISLANGCELSDNQGNVKLDSDQCRNALEFSGDLLKSYSVPGNQDADTTRASYFSGQAAMTIWSSFLLDELAGLRSDALPTCPECTGDPGYLAKNTGIISAIKGPDGEEPAGFGEVVSWNILKDASPQAKDLVSFMMSDGYKDWLAVAPEGKLPARLGTAESADEYSKAWQAMEAGVDKKALLYSVYSPAILKEITDSVDKFDRWGILQGQGALAAAVSGQYVIPKALASIINSGSSAQDAITQAQNDAESVKADIAG
jgi:multiple sugar transport system substrate-binding protein